MPVIANVEQAAAWDGLEGDYWSARAEHYERTTVRHRDRLLDAELIAAADEVVDVGCGTGALTRSAARRAQAGSALGVDLSRRMIERARDLTAAAGITNARFEQADAQVHGFPPGGVDTIVSAFGVMFFADPGRAFGNLADALRPGGRMGLLTWQELARNEWVTAILAALAVGRPLPEPPPGAPGPFGLADPDRVRALLRDAGMVDVDVRPFDEVVHFGDDAEQAHGFVAGMRISQTLIEGLDAAARTRALDELRATLVAAETADGVLFDSSAWLITARRS